MSSINIFIYQYLINFDGNIKPWKTQFHFPLEIMRYSPNIMFYVALILAAPYVSFSTLFADIRSNDPIAV